jgi:hypothetical protein
MTPDWAQGSAGEAAPWTKWGNRRQQHEESALKTPLSCTLQFLRSHIGRNTFNGVSAPKSMIVEIKEHSVLEP